VSRETVEYGLFANERLQGDRRGGVGPAGDHHNSRWVRLIAATAAVTALAAAEKVGLYRFRGAHVHVDVNPEPVRPQGPTVMAVHT
jgi:hypothetical protein